MWVSARDCVGPGSSLGKMVAVAVRFWPISVFSYNERVLLHRFWTARLICDSNLSASRPTSSSRFTGCREDIEIRGVTQGQTNSPRPSSAQLGVIIAKRPSSFGRFFSYQAGVF